VGPVPTDVFVALALLAASFGTMAAFATRQLWRGDDW